MFTTGFQGADEAAKQSAQKSVIGPRRFFIKENSEAQVSFIDDTAVSFYEHNFELNGNFNNYEHCIRQENGCPFCLGGKDPYRITVFTIIDHTMWTDKKGQSFVDQKKILAVRENQAVSLRDLCQLCNGLKGKRITIRRSGDKIKGASAGTSYSLAMSNGNPIVTDWSRYDRSILVPFDYKTIFAPKSRDALMAIYQRAQMSGQGMPVGYNQPYNQYRQPYYNQRPQQPYSQPHSQPHQPYYPPPQQYSEHSNQVFDSQPGVAVPAHVNHETSPADQFGSDIPF